MEFLQKFLSRLQNLLMLYNSWIRNVCSMVVNLEEFLFMNVHL